LASARCPMWIGLKEPLKIPVLVFAICYNHE
jgi:hypothetical protein